jgi:hypothetical protein
MTHYTGGCLCGAVRYSINAEPIRQLLCNCVDCQKHTGTAFVSGLLVPSEGASITGTMSTFTLPGGQSGEPMHRRFCTTCGSPILIEKDGTGRMLIMAGTLDDQGCSTLSIEFPVEERIGSGESGSISILTEC